MKCFPTHFKASNPFFKEIMLLVKFNVDGKEEITNQTLTEKNFSSEVSDHEVSCIPKPKKHQNLDIQFEFTFLT
jgi:hypothetical protein